MSRMYSDSVYAAAESLVGVVDAARLRSDLQAIVDLTFLDDYSTIDAMSDEAQTDLLTPVTLAKQVLQDNDPDLEVVAAALVVKRAGTRSADGLPDDLRHLIAELPVG